MSQNNSNTSLEKEISDKPLRIISLSNGVTILGKIVAMNQYVAQISFPVSLDVIFDSDEDIVGMSLVPYLAPFSVMSPFALVNFNINQIISFSLPSPDIAEKYEEGFRKISERYNENLDKAMEDYFHSSESHDASVSGVWVAPGSKTIH